MFCIGEQPMCIGAVSSEPSLLAYLRYGCRGRPECRPLAQLVTSAWAFKGGFCSCSISTKCLWSKYWSILPLTNVTKGTEVENKNDLDTTVHNAARIFSPIYTRNFFTLKGKLTILGDFFQPTYTEPERASYEFRFWFCLCRLLPVKTYCTQHLFCHENVCFLRLLRIFKCTSD